MGGLNELPHSTFTIRNRHGVELFVRLNGTGENPVALVAHGLSDVHDSPHMRAITSGLIAAGFDVVTYDATHSWGRSGGSFDQATLTAAYEDLCDVYAWITSQKNLSQPSVLAGHSLGGGAALRFAAEHPNAALRLVLVSPVVSGKLLARRLNPFIRTVWWMLGRLPEPGQKGKWYGYQLLHDGLAYDGPALARKLKVAVTQIAAQNDILIPLADQRLLAASFRPGSAELFIVKGADHTYSVHLDELERLITGAVSA